jgi:hypothetical protein
MKRGLNYLDVNTLKAGLSSGTSIEEIARQCSTYPEVIQKYLDSMDKEEVAQLRSNAPVTAGAVDVSQMKEELKAELREEMFGEEAAVDVAEEAEDAEEASDEEADGEE